MLSQGDILKRTDGLNAALAEANPYFHAKQDYEFFLVLTQTCDLVVDRGVGDSCKARYVNLAPVRSLEYVLGRFVSDLSKVRSKQPVLQEKQRQKVHDFLHRLFNNNEQGYFYLEADGVEILRDSVAILNLQVALKASHHYATCLDAKINELTPPFQAKVGWLIGQQYSRVATDDWDASVLGKKAAKTAKTAAVYIPDAAIKEVAAAALAADEPLDADAVTAIASTVKSKRDQVLDAAVDVIGKTMKLEDDPAMIQKIRQQLKFNSKLTALLGP